MISTKLVRYTCIRVRCLSLIPDCVCGKQPLGQGDWRKEAKKEEKEAMVTVGSEASIASHDPIVDEVCNLHVCVHSNVSTQLIVCTHSLASRGWLSLKIHSMMMLHH